MQETIEDLEAFSRLNTPRSEHHSKAGSPRSEWEVGAIIEAGHMHGEFCVMFFLHDLVLLEGVIYIK